MMLSHIMYTSYSARLGAAAGADHKEEKEESLHSL